jgi:hypothetical protein
MDCRCPRCHSLFKCQSSAFGYHVVCAVCHNAWTLDVAHLARFSIPKEIHVQLVDMSGVNLCLSGVAVFADYGCTIGPVHTADDGSTVLTQSLIKNSIVDSINNHEDYSLRRCIDVFMPSSKELREMAERRRSSGWFVLGKSEERFGSMESLIAAYLNANNEQLVPASLRIDLERSPEIIDCSLKISSNPMPIT